MFIILLLSQLSLADSLFSHGLYPEARIEYMREFFHYPGHAEDESKRLSYAVATLHVDTLKGVHELTRMINDMPNLTTDSRLHIARCFIALGSTEQARALLNGTGSSRLYGYTYLKDDDLTAAREYFVKLKDTLIVRDIDRYMKTPQKSLRTAALLSLLCPGTGEMYAGDVGLGIKDLLLNAGSIFLLYNAVRQKKYVDAVLVFNFLFHRFYVGSLYNAQKTAFQTNERAYDAWHDRMRNTYFKDSGDH